MTLYGLNGQMLVKQKYTNFECHKLLLPKGITNIIKKI